MAARCLSFQQREQICAHSASHPEMTQLAVAAWAKQTFALPAAPSQSFISTLLRRGRDGGHPAPIHPMPVRPMPTAKPAQPKTTVPAPSIAADEAATASSLQLEAVRRAYRPLLSDEMMRWVLTCDQPPAAAPAANNSTRSVKTEANTGVMTKDDGQPLSISFGYDGAVRAPRPNDLAVSPYWYLMDRYEDPYGSEYDSCYSGDESAQAERKFARRERRERWERWQELRERRREIVGSNAGEIECESDFNSQSSYMDSTRYVYMYEEDASARAEREWHERYYNGVCSSDEYERETRDGETGDEDDEYERETHESESGDEDDELETNDDGETGDEDGEVDWYGSKALEPRSSNDNLIVDLASILKREREWAALAEQQALVTTPKQTANESRPQPLASPAMGVSSTRVKIENSSQPLASSAFATVTTRVKLESTPMLNYLSRTMDPANELATRDREAALRLEALQAENSLKRAQAAEEHVLAHKRLRVAGVPQSEIDKLLKPVAGPLRKLLPKPATTT